MKMFFVIYATEVDDVVVSAFKNAGFKAYTKMCGLMGEGEESDPKLGTHYWPGTNNALWLAVQNDNVGLLCDLVRKLKEEHSRANLRAFIFPLEEQCV
jgi:hypothetical protein